MGLEAPAPAPAPAPTPAQAQAQAQAQAPAQVITEMKEMDVESAEPSRGDMAAAPAPPRKMSRKKKILVALAVVAGIVLFLVVLSSVVEIGGDDNGDMDDMEARTKLCRRWAHRHGMKGARMKHGALYRDGDDNDLGRKADDQDDIKEDDEDAGKYCRSGGEECGSLLLLKEKESGDESDLTVYAEEDGVKGIIATLSSKYVVMDPIPLPCAIRGKVGGDNDDKDH